MGLLTYRIPAAGSATASELSKLAGRPSSLSGDTLSTFVAPGSLSASSSLPERRFAHSPSAKCRLHRREIFANGCDELFRGHGFPKHSILTKSQSNVVRPPCHHHNGNVASLGVRCQFIADRQTIKNWQPDIENQQIGRIGFDDLQRFDTIFRVLHTEAGPEQTNQRRCDGDQGRLRQSRWSSDRVAVWGLQGTRLRTATY